MSSPFTKYTRETCPDREEHRPPAGPNEDVAQCPLCWALTFMMRPEGETFGLHLPDCSLPARHEGYCEPGGDGHSAPDEMRGYFPRRGSEFSPARRPTGDPR